MHLVLKSSQARGSRSFLTKQTARYIQHLILETGKSTGVCIREFANSGNHLHLLVQARTKLGFKKFIRIVTGKIAMQLAGSRKGSALAKRFWDCAVFTRIVEWGRDFFGVRKYLIQNRLEALGLVPYRTRNTNDRRRVLPGARSSPTLGVYDAFS
jgi:REP element-mobilizing transposase RayT